MSSHLEKFMQAWDDDDLDTMLAACADDFVYDDPFDGRMTKEEFADYYRGLSDDVETEHSGEVVQEADGGATHWLWWAWKPTGASGWAQQGAALTQADADGVHSMRIANYKGSGFSA